MSKREVKQTEGKICELGKRGVKKETAKLKALL